MTKSQKPVLDGNETTSTATEEDFLGRWSRLKSETGAHLDESGSRPAARKPAPAEEQSNPAQDQTDTDIPAPESLNAESDYSVFFSSHVSEELRRLALRKLFGSSKFNLRDGLDDYDENFANFEPLGDLLTCDMHHRIAQAPEETEATQQDRNPQAEETDQTAGDRLEPDTDEDSKANAVSVDGSREGKSARQASQDDTAKS